MTDSTYGTPTPDRIIVDDNKYTVAVDLGTTFTSGVVSYSEAGKRVTLAIEGYRDDAIPSGIGKQIPTELWYRTPHQDGQDHQDHVEENFIFSFSNGNNDDDSDGLLFGFSVQKNSAIQDVRKKGTTKNCV
jgi:hypothetical protein